MKAMLSSRFTPIVIAICMLFLTGCSLMGGSSAASKESQSTSTSLEFDPRKVQKGQKIAGIEIKDVRFSPVTSMNEGFYFDAATVEFAGEVEVAGTYEYMPSEHETMGNQIVFYIDETATFPKMKISEDKSKERFEGITLQFQTEEEKRSFGEPGTNGKATLRISDVTMRFAQSGVTDTASVKQIVSIAPEKKSQEPKVEEEKVKWIAFSSTGFPKEREALKSYFAEEMAKIAETEGQKKELEMSLALEDVNGDSEQDIIVALHDVYFTGGNWNSNVQIIPQLKGKLQGNIVIGQINLEINEKGEQKNLGILETTEQGWKKLMIDGKIARYNGKDQYDF